MLKPFSKFILLIISFISYASYSAIYFRHSGLIAQKIPILYFQLVISISMLFVSLLCRLLTVCLVFLSSYKNCMYKESLGIESGKILLMIAVSISFSLLMILAIESAYFLSTISSDSNGYVVLTKNGFTIYENSNFFIAVMVGILEIFIFPYYIFTSLRLFKDCL